MRKYIGAVLAALILAVPTVAIATQAEEDQARALVNDERRQRGIQLLSNRSCLATVAQQTANRNANQGHSEHTAILGQKVTNQCGSGWTRLGENVGDTPSGVVSLHNTFMGSSSHRANILDPGFGTFGIGIAHAGGRLYEVQVFKRP